MTDKFTEFEVTRVVAESEIITSFYLSPKIPLARDFVPGEYLVFEEIDASNSSVRREYSISGQENDEIRVTIKLESAPSADLSDGVMSSLFIHACENGRVHAMGAEMRALAKAHANLNTHFGYRAPDAKDQQGVDYDSQGMVDRVLLEQLLSGTECDFYLCGPGPFMQAMYDLLHDMGVARGMKSRCRTRWPPLATLI